MQIKKIDKLKELYNDQEMTKVLHNNLLYSVQQIGGAKAVQGEDTSGIKPASEAINMFFANLKAQYETKKEKKVDNPE